MRIIVGTIEVGNARAQNGSLDWRWVMHFERLKLHGPRTDYVDRAAAVQAAKRWAGRLGITITEQRGVT